MTLAILHQYDRDLAAAIAEQLPSGVLFTALGDTAPSAWKVPTEGELLLINQDSAAVGLHKNMKRPAGWPFALRWVHLRSTGVDKYPEWIFDVPLVTVTRGTAAVPISEYVIAAVLSFAKHIPAIWTTDRIEWRNNNLAELCGATVGIIGFGEIGKAVAHRALAFGMDVIAIKRTSGSLGMCGVESVSLPVLLARSDHIVLCTPLTAVTRGIIDANAFGAMKQGAHLINVGRGALIETDALRVALDDRLGGATLDVTDPEPLPDEHWLLQHPKVRISPHISGRSPQAQQRATAFFIDNLRRYREGEELCGAVDKALRY